MPQSAIQSNCLLIDFTGFLCVNCPLAADEAQRLHNAYPDNLVVVAMHPEDNPFTNTSLEKYDYTCPEANVYYNYFGGSTSTPFPTGIVDFHSEWLDYPSWAAEVRESMMQKKCGNVDVEVSNCNANDRSFSFSLVASVQPTAKVKAGELVETQVLLWLVADSIIGGQELPDGSTDLTYIHRHMLRASVLDDPWGWTVTCEAGESAIHTRIRDYKITDDIGGYVPGIDDYSLVAVMLEAETKELLDVKQIKLKCD